ncbi:class I SAM-dependent methyltransferase [Corynebacterium aquilae]|uniref:Methyltransferase type 11 domain-containing protein n=1 Tax=Corynebacterium aquilae DSM 44791 TaxID=1431546 RepID=A0A1L7CEC0_9CORY|nr:class I SAM-dependent methyltransferase [Corynebacterium aquilae]APT84164.1 hypothetical protein CAQU_02740 [Corynebacterium aquilae DSM 44791]
MNSLSHHGSDEHPENHDPGHYFDALAAQWDSPERVARAQALARVMGPHLPADTQIIIDFGCGSGIVGRSLGVRDVIGVEVSEKMREVAASHGVRVYERLDEVPICQVDAIVSSMVLHHVDDVAATLRELVSRVRPLGSVVVADLDAGQEFFHAHMARTDASSPAASDTPDPTAHVFHHGFDRDFFASCLEDAGLVDVRVVDGYTGVKEGSEGEPARQYSVFVASGVKPQ